MNVEDPRFERAAQAFRKQRDGKALSSAWEVLTSLKREDALRLEVAEQKRRARAERARERDE